MPTSIPLVFQIIDRMETENLFWLVVSVLIGVKMTKLQKRARASKNYDNSLSDNWPQFLQRGQGEPRSVIWVEHRLFSHFSAYPFDFFISFINLENKINLWSCRLFSNLFSNFTVAAVFSPWILIDRF